MDGGDLGSPAGAATCHGGVRRQGRTASSQLFSSSAVPPTPPPVSERHSPSAYRRALRHVAVRPGWGGFAPPEWRTPHPTAHQLIGSGCTSLIRVRSARARAAQNGAPSASNVCAAAPSDSRRSALLLGTSLGLAELEHRPGALERPLVRRLPLEPVASVVDAVGRSPRAVSSEPRRRHATASVQGLLRVRPSQRPPARPRARTSA